MKKYLTLIMLICAFAIQAQIPTAGLVGYYPFNGNANDASVTANNGAPVNGTALTTDRFGNANSAYNFDGADDYIIIPHNGVYNFLNYTISLWFKYNAPGTPGTSIWSLISKNNSNSGYNDAFHIWINNLVGTPYTVGGRMGTGGSEVYGGNPPAINNGQWHNAIVVFNNNTDQMLYYVDGVLISTSPFPGTNIFNPSEIRLGVWAGYGDYFNGKIDDVRIYNTPLNQAQITSLASECTINNVTQYQDADGDGYGNPAISQASNCLLAGCSLNNTDCNDANAAIHPGATEICNNGIDEDCNGTDFNCQYLALNFDGTDDYVNLGTGLSSHFNGGNSVTAEAWIYPTALNTYNTVVGDYNAFTATGMKYLLRIDGTTALFGIVTGGVHTFAAAPGSIATNQWYHLTGTWDGTTIKLYINGVLTASTSKSGVFATSSLITYIGEGETPQMPEYFTGKIDEVRIWNIARTASQIQGNMNCLLPAGQTGLVAYYNFNHISATAGGNNAGHSSLTDNSGNGNTGALNNFTLSGATSNWVSGNPFVGAPTTSSTTAIVCNNALPYVWNGNNYNTTGSFVVHLTNASGCDSAATLALTVNQSTNYYADADGDGFGNIAVTQSACSAPANFVSNNTDCDDADITVHTPQQYFVDADHDGFGSTTTAMVCSNTPTLGFSANNNDCNDADATVNAPVIYYRDLDNDGYGSSLFGTIYSCYSTSGYVLDNTDCFDDDEYQHPGAVWFTDADGDHYGNGISISQCLRPVNGFADDELYPEIDCNDNDGTVHEEQQYFVDTDNDGFGSSTSAMFCSSTPPQGYSSNSNDCNDANPNIKPGATEIPCNGIDENCNGMADDNIAPATPGTISGPTSVCSNQTVQYSVAPVANATLYHWNIPGGMTLTNDGIGNPTDGIGSNTITVTIKPSGTLASLRVLASNSCGSSGLSPAFTPTKPTVVPPTPTAINGTTTLYGMCAGSTQTFTTTSSGATSFNWTIPNGAVILSGNGTNTISVLLPSAFSTGTISVTGSNCIGTGSSRSLTIKSFAAAATSGISGPPYLCANSTYTFSYPALPAGATSLLWSFPSVATILSGQGTLSVQVYYSSAFTPTASFTVADIGVTGVNACGATPGGTALGLFSIPSAPNITGPKLGVCGNSTQVYSATSAPGVTSYIWTAPSGATITSGQGTGSVNVNFGPNFMSGSLSCYAVNACYTGAPSSITINSVPARPGTISGPTTQVCSGTSATYSVPAVASATGYQWTFLTNTGISQTFNTVGPSIGFNILNLTGSATLTVVAINACGSSTARSLVINSVPTTPAAIVGSSSVCANTYLNYSTTAVATATSYIWSCSGSSFYIISDGVQAVQYPASLTTTATTVTYSFDGTASRTIGVAAINACGTGTKRNKTITLTTVGCRTAGEVTVSGEGSITTFPNPATNQFTVQFNSCKQCRYSMRLIDELGRIALEKTGNAMEDENAVEFDVAALARGIYTLQFITNEAAEQKRIVIQ